MQYHGPMINNLIIDHFEIPLKEIKLATGDFSPKSRLEDDNNYNVYTGKLPSCDRKAAIKCHNWRRSVGMDKFLEERLLYIGSSHENINPFIGFCFEGNNKITVTDYAVNHSLDCHLQDSFKRLELTWARRLEICLGLVDGNQAQTNPTLGASGYYMDPISVESGILNKSSDVYAFRVVLFKLMGGMLASEKRSIGDLNAQHLIKLVRRYYDVGLDNLTDPYIRGQMNRRFFNLVKETAYKCISLNIKDRPTMDVIIKTIEEALDTHNHGADSIVTIRSHQHQNAKDFKISFSDFNSATKNFYSPIDRGSTQFRRTYEGQLPDRFKNRKAAIIHYDAKHGHHRDEFLNELDMICSLDHENIIPFIGYCEEEDEMIIVSEYATNGSFIIISIYEQKDVA
ncbi:hypothetical protein L1987_83505 [Smallanthus sonchifolius]|uniref:Uncharacterized protein n=1 Tax=Smallanthus sonchifolius TaxID=185202 RepID=A0ACB8YDM6_9ASTR|nr:hypothetical protein L1987_83505 [Smallanthus sonchifolius]